MGVTIGPRVRAYDIVEVGVRVLLLSIEVFDAAPASSSLPIGRKLR